MTYVPFVHRLIFSLTIQSFKPLAICDTYIAKCHLQTKETNKTQKMSEKTKKVKKIKKIAKETKKCIRNRKTQ